LMTEMDMAEKRMYNEMNEVSGKILEETQTICESLQRCQSLKQALKESIDQPVESWTDLKRRSVDMIANKDREDDTVIKSVEDIEIKNEIQWQSLVDDFTRHIRDRIDVLVQFEEIKVQSLSVLDDGDTSLSQHQTPKRSNRSRSRRNSKSKEMRNVAVSDKEKGMFLMDQVVTETRDGTTWVEPFDGAKTRKQNTPIRSPEQDDPDDRDDVDASRADPNAEWTATGDTSTPINWMGSQPPPPPSQAMQRIELMVLGFSKEANVYHYNLTAKLGEGVTDIKGKWKMANNMGGERHHVKYPSVVYHPRYHEVYRFGGVLDGQQLKKGEKYNIATRLWSQLKSGPIARQDAVSLLLNDSNIVTIGGAAKQFNPHTDTKEWKFYDDLSIYNLQTDVWCKMHISSQTQKLATMNQQRYGFAGLSLMDENKVVVFGGNGANGRLSTVEMYDYGINKWMYLEDMPIVKSRHSVVSYDGRVIVAGGDKKSESQKCFLFDMQQNSWHLMPMLNQKRDRPVLKVFEDKSCVIAAGHGLELKSFEVFDKRMRQQGWMLTTIQDHPLGVGFCAGMLAL